MSIEYEVDETKVAEAVARRRETRLRYRRERERGMHQIRIKPKDTIRIKAYYEEYITTCQQNQYPTVHLNDFIVQFCELGFFAWRNRNKGK